MFVRKCNITNFTWFTCLCSMVPNFWVVEVILLKMKITPIFFQVKKQFLIISTRITILSKLRTLDKKMIHNKIERRNDARYTIGAPASLTMENSSSFACMLILHDISSGGALVSSTVSIPQNVKVTLHTRLPFQQKLFGRDEVGFIFRGKVVRKIEETGQVAIQFDDDYRIII